ncbi:phage holin [Carnobacterium maltaromaticum]|uniref:phage holin n=1 Tax=Carnobacterium maltaromaticum TaxID=2751 RepID=UPI0010720884|nr:phage holin [Carnobacterium maltaromaticum]MDT1946071.1 phage holin [Carnobacterium maltaromaticum]MDT2000575.1 phage holin [Carnobacterium maltaromaticum]TFJ28872.1 phage holin [Carnobacterium maltaromaticum]TFJ32570.1 phage holin [Carnobacterium maltaromaticum]TFJ36598.1 phage holin [Carnobacterium maltaromaticum]
MKINWKVRIKSKTFWLSLIPILLVLIQQISSWFGIEFAKELIENEAMKFVNTLFLLLGIVGIVNDPTVPGISDSQKTLNN